MRQRVMIAMALACNPDVLIADEPTTALDVTTQAEILDLIRRLQQQHGMAVMFITHDMGVVSEIADDVLVMNHGKVMESGPVDAIFHAPKHDYTRMLIGSVLKLEQKAEIRLKRAPIPEAALPVLQVRNLSMHFGTAKAPLKAVDDVSLEVKPGETLGIVGESGSGKTTMGRCLLRIYDPLAGVIDYRRADGSVVDLVKADKEAAESLPARDPDDLPGSGRFAQPAHDGRPDHRRAAAGQQDRIRQGTRRSGRRSAAARSASSHPGGSVIRMRSPAASASASASPAPSRSIPGSSSPTRRPRRWMSRCARRCST